MRKISNKYWFALICVLLTVITLVIYWQVRNHEFIALDDAAYITKNDNIKDGITLKSLAWMTTTAHATNWHPLTWLSHALDVELYGLNPGGHHLTNVLFHIANTLLLFLILNQMTGKLYLSAFVAAAFAVHPVHVESVAWAAERKDVLSTFFGLLTMWSYVYYLNRPTVKRYLLLFLLFGIGLTAKQMLVTLPFVLILLDYWPLGRLRLFGQNFHNPSHYNAVSLGKCFLEKLPLFFLSALGSTAVYVVQLYTGVVKSVTEVPLLWRIENSIVTYIAYIGKIFWPAKLSVFYPHPQSGLPIAYSIGAALLLLTVTLAVIWKIKQRPYLAVGWLWYLGTLVPVIGFVQVFEQAMADRYTYFPSIGIFVMVTWGLGDLLTGWKYKKVALGTLATVVLLALSISCYFQLRYWRDSSVLFKHALNVTTNNYLAHGCLGYWFYEQGDYENAVEHYTSSFRINPDYSPSRKNLSTLHHLIGSKLKNRGDLEGAAVQYTKAIEFLPELLDLRNNLVMVLNQLDKSQQAVEICSETVKLYPDDATAQFQLGRALINQNQLDKAIKHFNKAISLNPKWLEAYYNLGNIYYRQKQLQKSVDCYATAIRLEPNFTDARIALARNFLEMGKIIPAVDNYYTILQTKPGSVDVLSKLSWILATNQDSKVRNPVDAVKFATTACQLTGYRQPEILDILAAAYASAGEFTRAVETAEKAIKLSQTQGKKNLADEINTRLQFYRTNRPYQQK